MGFVYDMRELGEYAKTFDLCRQAVRNTMEELAGNFIGKVEIKKTEDGTIEYDGDVFMTVLQSIHVGRMNSDELIAMIYDGYKLLAKEEKERERMDNEEPHEEGDETV